MITVVTSCSARGYSEYGKRCIETFAKHWPEDVALYVVSEDPLPDLPKRARYASLLLSEKAKAFDDRHRDNRIAHGRQQVPGQAHWTPKKIAEGYNFRFDAYRFAKKVFAIDIVSTIARKGRLFWLDADTITHANVSTAKLETFLPADKALCCLDRGQYHSECGFVGYNLDFGGTHTFIMKFADMYATDKVFDLPEWHDSWVFDFLRRKTLAPTYCIPHQSRSHPMVNSRLSEFLDHVKGARKAMGRTPKAERLLKDRTAYWL
jgi:hypothetical protein